MSKSAVQKYYARLIYKGIYTIDQVPEEDKGKVKEYLNDIINNLGPYVPDPETETLSVDNVNPIETTKETYNDINNG